MSRKQKVLIVEDEAISAMALSMNLRDRGYEVFKPVATGEEAVKSVEKETPDLVLMDLVLAGKLDGIEAAKEIQSYHDIPIILITGYQMDERTAERAKQVKPGSCLVKPLKSSEVGLVIDKTLQKTGA